MEEYPVDAIMAANGGAMPTTVEMIDATARYLAAQSVPMTPEEFAKLEPMPH